ncbi:hypothetical protein AcV5_009448 [Taiwanofungus camphoratus]|nr:hypothetical protein AcV5_009448 [Antrodia cinnamomea]
MLSIVDPMQMSQLCMCSIKVVYVSDWAMSSMLMMSDYLYMTILNQVEHLFCVQSLNDCKHFDEHAAMPPDVCVPMLYIDYLHLTIVDMVMGYISLCLPVCIWH